MISTLNSRNLPCYVYFWANPPPCRRPLGMVLDDTYREVHLFFVALRGKLIAETGVGGLLYPRVVRDLDVPCRPRSPAVWGT